MTKSGDATGASHHDSEGTLSLINMLCFITIPTIREHIQIIKNLPGRRLNTPNEV
jgi:hypothetical protein